MTEMSGESQFPEAVGQNDLNAERLELALQASNEGIWDWWVGQEDIFYTPRICTFFDRELREMPNIFLHPEDVVHESDLPMFRQILEETCANPEEDLLAIDCRLNIGGRDGRWLRIRGTVVRNDQGEAVRMAGSMIDISRRKRAEAVLEEERHLLRLLIDNMPLSVFFKNKSSRFTLTNKRMAQWIGGGSVKDLVGKCDHDFFSSEHATAALRDEQEVMRTRQPILDKLEKETWSAREDTWVQTSKFPWKNRNGEVIGTFGVSADVTELVEAQQEMAKLAVTLKEKNDLVEEELLLAREIQASFANPDDRNLREEGEWAAIEIDSFYVPITDLAGDFYEVLKIDDGVVGVLVADVMGHGVRSALIVAMLRGLIERERSGAADPGHFLTGLNAGLSRILDRAGVLIFATAFYVVLDLNKGTLEYACAGHPSAIVKLRKSARQLDTETVRGPALGIDNEAEYDSASDSLEGVSQLVLFTDGVYEVTNVEGEQLGQEGLVETVAKVTDRNVHALLDALVQQVEAFSETGKFMDDVCLVGIDFKRFTQP